MKTNKIEAGYNPFFSAKLIIGGNKKGLSNENIANLTKRAESIGTIYDAIYVTINKFKGGIQGRPINIVNSVRGSNLPVEQHFSDAPYRNNVQLLKHPFKIIKEYIDMIGISMRNPNLAIEQYNNKKEYYDLAKEIDSYYASKPRKSYFDFLFKRPTPCEAEKILEEKLKYAHII